MKYLFLIFNVFVLYLYTLFPTVAQYRDAGEMSVVGKILGIAHPPGYPLYTLILNIFIRIVPIGNVAYRTNIFSALISALSVAVLGFLIEKMFIGEEKKYFKTMSIYFFCLVFAFGYLQWYLSLVTEMYTFNIFFALVILYLVYKIIIGSSINIFLLLFIFGLGIGNRLDLVLFSPIIFFVLIKYFKNKKFCFKTNIFLLFIVFVSFSGYLYLIIRSSQVPLINWNAPSKIENFISSIIRKTHGSTLDLLSVNYKEGENFFPGAKLYLNYLMKNITLFGVILGFYGLGLLYKKNKFFCISLFFSWLISSVWFIYKANLPPNPHAMSILEAHFLLANSLFYTFFIYGTIYFFKNKYSVVLLLFLIFLTGYNLTNNWNKLNKRDNYFAYDYVWNLFRCLPGNSLVVIREDVQVFSCWYGQIVCKKRNDLNIIAEGLSGSIWYMEMYKKYKTQNIFLTRLNYETWPIFVKNNFDLGNDIYLTYDIDFLELENYKTIPSGLCSKIVKRNSLIQIDNRFLLDDVMFYRNEYIYDLEKEFFSSDLVEDYTKARHNQAYNLMMIDKDYDAINEYKKSMILNPDYPMNYFYIGYTYYKLKDYLNAEKYYFFSVKKYDLYYKLAKKYNALNNVVESFKLQLANAYLNLGVVNEKLGKIDDSINNYNNAIKIKHDFAQAYYNLGVSYWQKNDWDKVKYYFEKVLFYDPNNQQVKYYLEKIKRNE